MPAYLITGVSGSGKTTVGQELALRGFTVINTDELPGLGTYVDNKAWLQVKKMPSYPLNLAWISSHSWLWREKRLEEFINQNRHLTILFCGRADNQKDMYRLFKHHFTLQLADRVAIKRLRSHNDKKRWRGNAPELVEMLKKKHESEQEAATPDNTVINSDRPIAVVVDEILKHVEYDQQ